MNPLQWVQLEATLETTFNVAPSPYRPCPWHVQHAVLPEKQHHREVVPPPTLVEVFQQSQNVTSLKST